ncbi:MAG TPA: glycerol kinase GlpK [Terriglobales bacterium]|nr:glycerol kinase GlpK [Terriglobales bacterium]
MRESHILALDQGTTSSRAIVFDHAANIVSMAQQEFEQIYPEPGHVEHNPGAIWSSQLSVAQEALRIANITAEAIAGIGITNQRETTLLWERATGKPIGNAIVWQSRISAPICERLKSEGYELLFRQKTGLVLDPYFSGTKIAYRLESIPDLRSRCERGEILFGTVDTYLIWRLTQGRIHVTDVSNASRTLLFNLHTLDWDDELLRILNIPRAILPQVRSSSEIYGETDEKLFGLSIPIAGIAGDQQAALFGQACFMSGDAKNTYGTGCFLLMNTGEKPFPPADGLLTTVAWKVNGKTTYAVEGAVFIGGAVVQWLRDGLKFIRTSAEIEELASQVADSGGVYLVPAFVGLGAPHWDPYARGVMVGLRRETTVAHIAQAALESIAYQSRDVLELMQNATGLKLSRLKVDGGASVNSRLMQFQADILDVCVTRPKITETTALGAAYLAGLATDYWQDTAHIVNNWLLDREFQPTMQPEQRTALVRNWQRAVQRSLAWDESAPISERQMHGAP